MFIEKKKSLTDTSVIESKDKRESYRYEFKEGEGLYITFKNKNILALDISVGGLSFKNDGFGQLDSDFVNFKLDIPDFNGGSTINAGIRILTIDQNNICHTIFEQCSLKQHELLHKYVIEMQKNDLTH